MASASAPSTRAAVTARNAESMPPLKAMMTEPSSARRASRRAALSARPSVLVGEAVLVVFVVFVLVKLLVVLDVVVIFVLLVVEVVLVGDFELDGRVVDDAEQGAALRAGELVADVDI